MVEWQEGNLIQDKETDKNDLNLRIFFKWTVELWKNVFWSDESKFEMFCSKRR